MARERLAAIPAQQAIKEKKNSVFSVRSVVKNSSKTVAKMAKVEHSALTLYALRSKNNTWCNWCNYIMYYNSQFTECPIWVFSELRTVY